MARSFDIVDFKVQEAEYFLSLIRDRNRDMYGIPFLASAFAAAARSITFAMQACMDGIPGFAAWYEQQQCTLRESELARFFHEFRRTGQHLGANPVRAGSGGPGEKWRYWFVPTKDLNRVPEEDVATACENYFLSLLEIVFQCYVEFGVHIDPQQYFTQQNFDSLGKDIGDALEELGFPRSWFECMPGCGAESWRILRSHAAGSHGLAEIFYRYLGKHVPHPDDGDPD